MNAQSANPYGIKFVTTTGISFSLAEVLKHLEREMPDEEKDRVWTKEDYDKIIYWFSLSQKNIDDFAKDRLRLNMGSVFTH